MNTKKPGVQNIQYKRRDKRSCLFHSFFVGGGGTTMITASCGWFPSSSVLSGNALHTNRYEYIVVPPQPTTNFKFISKNLDFVALLKAGTHEKRIQEKLRPQNLVLPSNLKGVSSEN